MTDNQPDKDENKSQTSEDVQTETIEGEIIATRTLPTQTGEFNKAVMNHLQFRNLDAGTYKLVKVKNNDK